MANKILVFDKLAYDPASNQYFQLIFIDNGTSFNQYIKDVPQPVNPGLASAISSSGAIPVIAPSGSGDVIGLGTTNTLPLWTNGPGSVIGDSIVSQNAGATIVTITGGQIVTGHVALEGGAIKTNTILDITNAAFAPSAQSFAINIDLTNGTGFISNGISINLTETASKNSSNSINGLHFISAGTLTQSSEFFVTTLVLAGAAITTQFGSRMILQVQGTVGTANLFQAAFGGLAGGVVTTLNGFTTSWANAGGATITESRGIFLGTDIDIGTTRYAILSRSTSQSRFVGKIRIGGDTAPVATLDVTGTLLVSSSITVTGLTANSFLFSGTAGLLTTTAAPTNGQILIGSTGVAPVVGAITGTANQITVTLGAGTIALSLPATVTVTTAYQVNATQVVTTQQAAVPDAAGGVVIDAEARAALNSLLAKLRTHGLIAT